MQIREVATYLYKNTLIFEKKRQDNDTTNNHKHFFMRMCKID